MALSHLQGVARIQNALKMKQKQIISALLLTAGILFVVIFFCREDPDSVVIKITSETKAFTQDIYPPGPDVYALKTSCMGMWDDTIILEGIKLPPKKIKNIGKPIDFYGNDPIKFSYDPYKAKNVKLKIVYDFCR